MPLSARKIDIGIPTRLGVRLALVVARSNAKGGFKMTLQAAETTNHDGVHRSQRGATGRGA